MRWFVIVWFVVFALARVLGGMAMVASSANAPCAHHLAAKSTTDPAHSVSEQPHSCSTKCHNCCKALPLVARFEAPLHTLPQQHPRLDPTTPISQHVMPNLRPPNLFV